MPSIRDPSSCSTSRYEKGRVSLEPGLLKTLFGWFLGAGLTPIEVLGLGGEGRLDRTTAGPLLFAQIDARPQHRCGYPSFGRSMAQGAHRCT